MYWRPLAAALIVAAAASPSDAFVLHGGAPLLRGHGPASLNTCLRPTSVPQVSLPQVTPAIFTAAAARRTSTARILHLQLFPLSPHALPLRHLPCCLAMEIQQTLRPKAWFLVHPPSHIIPAIFFPPSCIHCETPVFFRDGIGARAEEAAVQGATITRRAASPSRLRMSTGGGGLRGSDDDDEDGKDEAGMFDNIMDSPLYRSTPSRLLPTPRPLPSSPVEESSPPLSHPRNCFQHSTIHFWGKFTAAAANQVPDPRAST
jgi:hypothetical protein